MRKIYFLFTFITFVSALNAQETHEVGNVGFEFTPDTIHIQSGDFIHFTSSGSHSMTEVDESTWLADGNASNGGFDTGVISDTDVTFEVTGSGTLFFVCMPHASFGMKGVIIVDAPNSIEDIRDSSEFSVYPNPVVSVMNLNVSPEFKGKVQLVDLSGKIRLEYNVHGLKSLDLSVLSAGFYFVRFVNTSGDTQRTIRVIKD